VLGPDGTIESTRSVPREDSVFITVTYRERRREIHFSSLAAWPEVDPRDQMAIDLRDELADEEAELFVPLTSYAEQCYMNRWNPKME
jgi:hypothetical protein